MGADVSDETTTRFFDFINFLLSFRYSPQPPQAKNGATTGKANGQKNNADNQKQQDDAPQ